MHFFPGVGWRGAGTGSSTKGGMQRSIRRGKRLQRGVEKGREGGWEGWGSGNHGPGITTLTVLPLCDEKAELELLAECELELLE